MLRIAVPNKGSLCEPAVTMLKEAGYKVTRRGRELTIIDKGNDVEFFFLRPRDIAVYVGSGVVSCGITGRDLLIDSGVEAVEYLGLDFARSTFRFAGPADQFHDLADIQGKRVATSYDLLLKKFLDEHGISEVRVVHLDGAVESSVQLGIADLIADVVETGSTLRAAGLQTFGEPLLESEALLITTAGQENHAQLQTLAARLRGVMVARTYVLMDYNAPSAHLADLLAITPGIESPTISDLAEDTWKAVRVMVKAADVNLIMDRLYAAGARGILVTDLKACRL